ncbi:hypothetical protein C6Y40_21720 [Alteromonas alba]|jgi:hypothetical protein|uniref:Cytochrome c n=1 Tax=Alteromonas alba TaxID=2079529 RepID=A0A2S9V529_9ALTE|nr:hypothetical protein [Alteromonas alba]MAD09305.1 hypothetical protein [Alteromonas sp.]MCP4866882.1 hypothetical protein [Alteromonas sp.]PRO71562.1 hypothetical protein C6Y40_21720 [Alteromonas alba]HAU93721.1 hypothetical protein [Alteromonas sp.]HCA76800.1 hypothetical protein [Alteromonas sp.]|tara:strand:+ start:4337 stop:4798 length:462 start_codon:yes stop_codon:yes gene_type:complete
MRLTNLHRKLAGAAVVITALLAGCSYNLSDVRKVTYPPDFNYIEPQDIKTDMARMAAQIRLLDIALAPVDSSDIAARENQREEVMAALNNIENIASGLQSVDGGSNHPYMQDFMRDFVAKVDKARGAASLAEPRYYFAGKVAGGCAVCHQVNR